MPTNYNEGTPRDPNIAKQLNKLYRNSSAPESNTYQASRKKLENSFRAKPSARPEPQVSKQPFTENIHSRDRPKGYEDKAAQARQQARREYLQRTGQIQEIARGARRNPANFIPKAAPTTVVNSPTSTPRPAIPGASLASGVASLGLGFLIDRYATPYLMDKAQRAGGFLGANLAYKSGKISEFELEAALQSIRSGNPTEWGNRINEIRRIQNLAKKGIRSRIIESEQLPFTGGQSDGVLYIVTLGNDKGEREEKLAWGPVGGAVNNFTISPPGYNNDFQIVCRGFLIGGLQGNNFGTPQELKGYSYGFAGSFDPTPMPPGTIVGVRRNDGLPEIITSTNQTQRTKQAIPSIIFQPNFFPPTPPTTDKIPEINKAKPNIIIIPAGFPIGVSSGDKNTTITPSTTAPSKVEIPHPRTIPPDPDGEKKVPPLMITNPNSPDIKLETSDSGPVTINIPGYNPITVTPATNKPQGALPIQDVARQYAPTAISATPTKPGTTPTTTPTPTTPKPATTDDLDKFKKDLEKLITTGAILAGLTPAIQTIGERVTKIGENTTPESLTTAAAAGTCRTTQPGGCTTKALDDAVSRVNQNTNQRGNLLDQVNAAANAEQIRRLDDITNRIGAQLPGGLAGASTRLSRFLGIDRIFNLLNFLAILHNASMLSASLKVTLLETLSSVGNATGLLQTSEGDNVDLNQVFNQGIETFVVSLIGAEAYAGLKLTWRKYSSIYRAGANVLSNVGNMFSSIGNGIEVIGERTGKIGNAIRAAGMVRENAYNWMSENMTVHTNKFMTVQTTVGGVTEVLEAINEVAESTIEGQQSYTEAIKATAEFKKSLEEGKKSDTKDAQNKAIAEEAAKIKENISKDPTGEKDEGYLSFLTD